MFCKEKPIEKLQNVSIAISKGSKVTICLHQTPKNVNLYTAFLHLNSILYLDSTPKLPVVELTALPYTL